LFELDATRGEGPDGALSEDAEKTGEDGPADDAGADGDVILVSDVSLPDVAATDGPSEPLRDHATIDAPSKPPDVMLDSPSEPPSDVPVSREIGDFCRRVGAAQAENCINGKCLRGCL
jgi:hypothetical protein